MWSCWRVAFALRSPLHAGWRKQGNVHYTRPYIPASTVWGALTARMTREGCFTGYENGGRWVDDSLALTYFYLSDRPDQVTGYPWRFGATQRDNDRRLPADAFAWKYMGSFVSTALADGYVKEDGSLHETEFLSPASRPAGAPVYAVGWVMAHLPDDGKWQTALAWLELGAERSYGWGRVRLLDPVGPGDRIQDVAGIRLDTPRPWIRLDSGVPAPAHVRTGNGAVCDGELEPLIGRVTNARGEFGATHSDVVVAWPPGSRVERGGWFEIAPRGILRRVDE